MIVKQSLPDNVRAANRARYAGSACSTIQDVAEAKRGHEDGMHLKRYARDSRGV